MTTPLFDSLTHPSLSGKWLDKNSSFDLLLENLEDTSFKKVCAVGMPGIGSYRHAEFIEKCKEHSVFVPVAGAGPDDLSNDLLVRKLKAMGFKAIKLHPRFYNIGLNDSLIQSLLKQAEKHDMPIFLCTYRHTTIQRFSGVDSLIETIQALKNFPRLKVCLMHGGDVRVLEYSELVRHNSNLLLDLSTTMMKYSGSSIDQDIKFLFEKFDRRICIGSDFPDYTPKATQQRFEYFSSGLSQEKLENIAYKNLAEFLNVEIQS